jgi:hypothetical protein
MPTQEAERLCRAAAGTGNPSALMELERMRKEAGLQEEAERLARPYRDLSLAMMRGSGHVHRAAADAGDLFVLPEPAPSPAMPSG